MKEIGGYMELEELSGKEFYPNLLKLNLGRTALIFAINKLRIKKLWLPLLLCDSVTHVCRKCGIELSWYSILDDFTPVLPEKKFDENEYLYLVNYYGQLSPECLLNLKKKYKNIILDNTHAFFQEPLETIPTLYSCRKFFGLPDGAYLYLDNTPNTETFFLPIDKSAYRMTHILGRYESPASTYYSTMLETAHSFYDEPVKSMSRLTQNLLRGIDYAQVCRSRNENYAILEHSLQTQNHLLLRTPKGPFVYPFYCTDGIQIRKKLADKKIFVPTYWSNVIEDLPKESLEYNYAANILPLPCDQRYNAEDMRRIVSVLNQLMKGKNDK